MKRGCSLPFHHLIGISFILTSVRYKLVYPTTPSFGHPSFPKEGKPCGRSYIKLTLSYIISAVFRYKQGYHHLHKERGR